MKLNRFPVLLQAGHLDILSDVMSVVSWFCPQSSSADVCFSDPAVWSLHWNVFETHHYLSIFPERGHLVSWPKVVWVWL